MRKKKRRRSEFWWTELCSAASGVVFGLCWVEFLCFARSVDVHSLDVHNEMHHSLC
jgi:hypothetical protein